MSSLMRKIIALSASLALAIVAVSPFLNVAHAAAVTVTPSDLATAGFHDIQIQSAQGSAYQLPNMYFHVRESVAAAHPEWGTAANLVAVLIVPTQNGWIYNNGAPDILDIAGRTQVRATRPGYYIVVTGPDKTMVMALSAELLNK